MNIDNDTLSRISQHLYYCGSADTAYDHYEPKKYGSLHNHCGCVAYTLQKLLGGQIVSGKINNILHRWNRIDNTEVDLCAEQFGRDKIFFPANGTAKTVKTPIHTNPRFLKFWDRFVESYYQ